MCNVLPVDPPSIHQGKNASDGALDHPRQCYHLVLAPAHCRADTSYYRTDSAPIRLSADRAADSETYRLDIASTGVCHRGDMIFSKKHCRADNYCHCRPDSMAKIKTCRPDISSAGTHYRADNAPSDHHYRPTNFPDIMMDSVQMSGR